MKYTKPFTFEPKNFPAYKAVKPDLKLTKSIIYENEVPGKSFLSSRVGSGMSSALAIPNPFHKIQKTPFYKFKKTT